MDAQAPVNAPVFQLLNRIKIGDLYRAGKPLAKNRLHLQPRSTGQAQQAGEELEKKQVALRERQSGLADFARQTAHHRAYLLRRAKRQHLLGIHAAAPTSSRSSFSSKVDAVPLSGSRSPM